MIYFNLGPLPPEVRSYEGSMRIPTNSAARVEPVLPISKPMEASTLSRAKGPGIAYQFIR